MNGEGIKQKSTEISGKKYSDEYNSAIANCIEEIPQLIRDGIDKWSGYIKDEKDFKIKMSNRALVLIAIILIAASVFTYLGTIDGQTYAFLLGSILGYTLTFIGKSIGFT